MNVSPTKPDVRTIDFNAIYLDTQVLVSASWPAPSLEFENCMKLAAWLNVGCYLPLPVEEQAEARWLRQASSAAARVDSSVKDFNRLTKQVSGRSNSSYENLDDLKSRYRAVGGTFKTQYGISSIPMTVRPLAEFFTNAVRYVLPFEEGSKNNRGEGKGFQDAIILASVLEHLRANPHLSGVIVTDDTVFSKVDLEKFMPECASVRLRVLPFDAVWNLLFSSHWDEHIKKPWEEESRNAKAAVEAIEAELRGFIALNMTDDLLRAGGGSSAVALASVKSVEISHVTTPIYTPEKPDRMARIAISLIARCRAFVKDTPWSIAVSALAGGPSALAGGWYSDSDVAQERDLVWIGGVEATAEIKNRKFSNITFKTLLTIERANEESSRIIKERH